MSVGWKDVDASAERWMSLLRDGPPGKNAEFNAESYRFDLIRFQIPIRKSDVFGERGCFFFTPRFVFVGAGSLLILCASRLSNKFWRVALI